MDGDLSDWNVSSYNTTLDLIHLPFNFYVKTSNITVSEGDRNTKRCSFYGNISVIFMLCTSCFYWQWYVVFTKSKEIKQPQHKVSQWVEQLLVEPSFLKQYFVISMTSHVVAPTILILYKVLTHPAFSIHLSIGSWPSFHFGQTKPLQFLVRQHQVALNLCLLGLLLPF